jgi:hypothetical protein
MNNDFISIKTCSGYFNFLVDPAVPEILLAPTANEEEIGRAVLDALSRSQISNPEVNEDFFNLQKASQRYEEWVSQTMMKYGYKTKRALFSNMKNCWIDVREDILIIKPSCHIRLEEWGRKKSDGLEDVVVSVASSAHEVGSALKEAFNRCM